MKAIIVKIKNRIENISVQCLFLLVVAMVEILFHVHMYGKLDEHMLWAVLFSVPFVAFVSGMTSTKNEKWNVGMRCVMLFVVVLYYTVQLVYHQVFGNFLSLKSIFNGAQQAMDFGSTIWEALGYEARAIGMAVVLWILYVVAEMFLIKKRQTKVSWKRMGACFVVALVLPVLLTVVLMLQEIGVGTTYEVKIGFHRTEQSMYRLGLLQTLKKDFTENICDEIGITEKQLNMGYLWIEHIFFDGNVDKLEKDGEEGSKSDILLDGADTTVESTVEVQKYHTWAVDFDALIANAKNEDIKDVHTYFSQQEPTAENDYTGLFEGYNLIYITAESFSDVVIDKERTPILYRMQQEGFQFRNFYTPSWYLSTIDGEYVNLLGQIPVENDWSLQHSAENEIPIALGNQLAEQGYACNAYHNHDSYYYDRTITHPKLGYSFKAVGAGLAFESMYPESDLELMEITVDEYINQDAPFHTYYMTMSGHLPYTYAYNSMAVKNQEVVADEAWSENAACYLAANTELEYAVAYLVEQLEAKGKLDNTLFVIVPDHYPYGLKKGAYDELQGKEVENDDFEIYRNTCLIWSASMKDMEEISFPVQVDKYCSNLDVLPTISNLMGLSFDSRLFAGRDMLSAENGVVMFKDHSFLTDKVRYNAITDETIWTEGVTEDNIYLESCMELVQNRFYYSAKVLELDYYNLIK